MRITNLFLVFAGGAIVFVLLVIIIIAIAASGPRPETDSASAARVVDGKYANTITSCGKIQGYVFVKRIIGNGNTE